MIEIKNLSKTFLKDGLAIEVLKELNLRIDTGESLAVVGVSGSGKSTLIHILGTLDHPTSGAVLFDGVDVFTWPEQKLAAFRNRKIGFIFQFHNLLPEFTSLENTMMPALIRRMPKRRGKREGGGASHRSGAGRPDDAQTRRALRRRTAARGNRPGIDPRTGDPPRG